VDWSNSGQPSFQPEVPLPTENLEGIAALKCDLRLLREGLRLLEQTADYTGTFRKQERVNGVLDEGSLITVKGRHQPFSLYLKWLEGDVGRELLYVEDQNDGEMLVRLGGLRGRFMPTLKLDPDGDLVRDKVRHHVSHLSILKLTRQVVEHREQDIEKLAGIRCEMQAANAGEWIEVSTFYETPEAGGEYRKSMHCIDRETLLPVKVQTYGWPELGQKIPADKLDDETLLEHYEYSDLRFDHNFGDEDFHENNPQFRFRRGG
jgi:hypothetical protein